MSGSVPQVLLQNLLNDPVKRALVLQILNQNKKLVNKSKEQRTPSKSKKPKNYCESPTALFRRKALEQLNNEITENSSSGPSTPTKDSAADLKVPQEQLLSDVIAFVDVKKDGVDRSEGIKEVMRSMGAQIKDELTRQVTHVIYKGGSFSTYQKARLLKCHLVSVIWLRDITKCGRRLPEANYRAFELNQDETFSLTQFCANSDRRKTIGTPSLNKQSRSETSRRLSVMHDLLSQIVQQVPPELTSDESSINSNEKISETPQTRANSPDVTSNDSVCGILDGCSYKNMDFQNFKPSLSSFQLNLTTSSSSSSTEELKTQNVSNQSKSLISKKSVNGRHQTELSSIEMDLTDIATPSKLTSLRKSQSRISSDLTKTISTDKSVNNTKQIVNATIGTMSSLRISTESNQRNNSSSRRKEIKQQSNQKNANSSAKQSTMSSLRISDASDEVKNNLSNEPNSNQIESNDNISKSNKRKSRVTKSNSCDIISNAEMNQSCYVQGRSKQREIRRKTSKFNDIVVDGSNTSVINQSDATDNHTTNQNIESSISSSVVTNESKKRKRESDSSIKETSLSEHENTSVRKSKRFTKINKSQIENASKKSIKDSNQKSTSTKVKEDELQVTKKQNNVLNIFEASSSEDELSSMPQVNNHETQRSDIENIMEKPLVKRRRLFNPDNYSPLKPLSDNGEREEIMKQKILNKQRNVNKRKTIKKPPKSISQNEIQSKIQTDDKKKIATNKAKTIINKSPNKKIIIAKTAVNHLTTPSKSSQNQDEKNKQLTLDSRTPRRSRRVSLSQKPTVDYKALLRGSPIITNTTGISNNRRSSMEFQSVSQMQRKCRLKIDPVKPPSIVCTRMHRPQVLEFIKAVKQLGKFQFEYQVTMKTTHLIAGEAKRTINMLRAIARGCWILRHEWLYKSLEEGKWLPEEDYELTEFSSAVQQCRLYRQAFGNDFTVDIFQDCGNIYISNCTKPPRSELVDLVRLCKGKITKNYQDAKIIVGELICYENICCVTELWILDSITVNKLKSIKNYLIERPKSPDF